jgi:ATP-dependent helicase HrpA
VPALQQSPYQVGAGVSRRLSEGGCFERAPDAGQEALLGAKQAAPMSGPRPPFTERRRAPIHFPEELPISASVGEIGAALERHQVLIVAGATGSGKTTQLPKICLELGRGTERCIGVTQPRRIAATSVAARVASELECSLGAEVGYQIRFEDKTSPETYVKFMTDGILLAEIQGDELLRRYDTLIIDEAHERSLNIDFILGWLKRILPRRRDLKVIVSSATIETERFSQFFDGAPVLKVEGRTFPVEVLYEPPDPELDLAEATANAVENVCSLEPRGDVLVFLPGEREIHETEQELSRRKLRHTEVLPLYSRLSAAEQNRVFASTSGRKVILSTNIAETSITLPGIVYVIDTGTARLSRYDPRTGTTRLQVEGISRASADQRKGRSGRVREGVCVRLYDEDSFKARPEYTDPEIKRTGLAGVILRMKSLRLGDVEDFPFIDAPRPGAIAEGYRVLEELGALTDKRELTPLGKQLSRFPVDPRLGRMILAGAENGSLPEVLVVVAGLNVQDVRERPRAHEQKADELHRRFRDERSDFAGLLKLWAFVKEAQAKGTSQLRRACKENFLSFVRVREWMEIHRQLEDTVRELRLGNPKVKKGNREQDDRALHLALLSGLLSKVGQYQPEHRNYLGARQTRFAIHPSSALAKRPPAWVMAFELVQTSQLFARTVAKIEPEWLAKVGSHLLKRTYSDPHWSEKSARASVKEQATLYGFPVIRGQSVDYATIAPGRARLIFIEHALIRGEYRSPGAFQRKNRELLAEVSRLRDKARRSDMLADEDTLLSFFDQRLPASVVNGKTFEAWRERAERKEPNLLVLSLEDVLSREEALSPDDYPDVVTLHGVPVRLAYRFDPSAEDDGITYELPLALVPQLDPGELEWTIPAWRTQKIAALLDALPKSLRRELGASPALAKAASERLVPYSGPLLPALSRAVSDLTGVDVTPEAFRPDAIPAYLRPSVRVLDERGKVLGEGRDVAGILQRLGAQAREALRRLEPAPKWERTGLTSWSFGDLPPFVTRRAMGTELHFYPALVDKKKSVDLVLLESADQAEQESRHGVARLLALASAKTLATLAARVPAPPSRHPGLPPSRADVEAFRELFLLRAIGTAFDLGGEAPLPRTKAQFDALLSTGTPKLEPAVKTWVQAFTAAMKEREVLERALNNAAKQPSGAAAVRDIRAQLELLFPADLMRTVALHELLHYPRYLRAAQIRLTRAIADPRKDADKAAPVAPLWSAFLEKQRTARDRQRTRTLRWAFEELRVAIFAPELKPAVPVNVASLSQSVAALR